MVISSLVEWPQVAVGGQFRSGRRRGQRGTNDNRPADRRFRTPTGSRDAMTLAPGRRRARPVNEAAPVAELQTDVRRLAERLASIPAPQGETSEPSSVAGSQTDCYASHQVDGRGRC